MRVLGLAAMLSLATATSAMAQSNSGSATLANSSSAPQETSYMIAPGVSVTSFYQDAPTSVSSYTPDTTASSYQPEAYVAASYDQPVHSRPMYGSMTTAAITTQGYVQQTPYDNTPYRFDMQQNGRQMSAQDFDSWMKAKGIRVVGGSR